MASVRFTRSGSNFLKLFSLFIPVTIHFAKLVELCEAFVKHSFGEALSFSKFDNPNVYSIVAGCIVSMFGYSMQSLNYANSNFVRNINSGKYYRFLSSTSRMFIILSACLWIPNAVAHLCGEFVGMNTKLKHTEI